jgi:hypothetical protein
MEKMNIYTCVDKDNFSYIPSKDRDLSFRADVTALVPHSDRTNLVLALPCDLIPHADWAVPGQRVEPALGQGAVPDQRVEPVPASPPDLALAPSSDLVLPPDLALALFSDLMTQTELSSCPWPLSVNK